jgi:NitT/TauT family transport system substrate-binding protein
MAVLFLFQGGARAAEPPLKIVVSVPGPRNLSYLPIDLIPKLGTDRAEGAEVRILHTGGGAVAMQHLMSRNSDFAVAGLPAAMSLRANGGKVVTIAAVDDLPSFVLMVRSGLKGRVRRIADLKGRVIGVNTSSISSKTTSQQLAELLLRSDGVSPDAVRIIPAGQSWVEQSSLLISGDADAVMGDEPFASRLLAEGRVFFLANLSDAATTSRIPGAGFLHAAVETRQDVLETAPAKVEKMVGILHRTLSWMSNHTPEQIVDRFNLPEGEEKTYLLAALKRYPRMYSPDGRFSTRQLAETERFFRETSGDEPAARALRLESMVVDRWAGRKP